jgi:hypothetical protein
VLLASIYLLSGVEWGYRLRARIDFSSRFTETALHFGKASLRELAALAVSLRCEAIRDFGTPEFESAPKQIALDMVEIELALHRVASIALESSERASLMSARTQSGACVSSHTSPFISESDAR